MLKTAPRPFTVDDYREMPEGPPFYQLIEGELVMSPSPNSAHQVIHSNIFSAFVRHLDKNPVGQIYSAPFDIYLTELNVYQPDLIYISNARKKQIIGEQGVEGAPELVVEILSPRTSKLDRGIKRSIYARTGVRELWIVDPASEQVDLFDFKERVEEPAGTYSKPQRFKSHVLPKFTVRLSEIFKYD